MPSQEQMPRGGSPPRSGGAKTAVADPACPKCRGGMTVKQVTPVLFASNIDDLIYGCEACGTEVKRSVKRA